MQLLVKPLKKIKIRNVNNRSVIRTLTVLKPSPVNSLVLKNNGNLASASGDTTKKLWHLFDGSVIRCIKRIC